MVKRDAAGWVFTSDEKLALWLTSNPVRDPLRDRDYLFITSHAPVMNKWLFGQTWPIVEGARKQT